MPGSGLGGRVPGGASMTSRGMAGNGRVTADADVTGGEDERSGSLGLARNGGGWVWERGGLV